MPSSNLLVVYIAHPLGGAVDREANRAKAQRWVAWAAARHPIAPIADWIILSGEWDESLRNRGLAIDFALIERCDEVWLVGGRVSPGMQLEADHARACVKVVRDLTFLGDEPPTDVRLVVGGLANMAAFDAGAATL